MWHWLCNYSSVYRYFSLCNIFSSLESIESSRRFILQELIPRCSAFFLRPLTIFVRLNNWASFYLIITCDPQSPSVPPSLSILFCNFGLFPLPYTQPPVLVLEEKYLSLLYGNVYTQEIKENHHPHQQK